MKLFDKKKVKIKTKPTVHIIETEDSEMKPGTPAWEEYQEYLNQGEQPKKSRCVIL